MDASHEIYIGGETGFGGPSTTITNKTIIQPINLEEMELNLLLKE